MSKSKSRLIYDPDLAQYMKQVNKYPLLSRKEEQQLFKEYNAGSFIAKNSLIKANLRFVVKIAYKYNLYTNYCGCTIMDLIQEGNSGLMHAIKKFDSKKNVRLVSYAIYWIQVMIMNHVIRTHSIVRIGTNVEEKQLFFKFGPIKDLLNIRETQEKDEQREILAKKFNLPIKLIQQMEKRISASELSFDIKRENSSKSGENKDSFSLYDVYGNKDFKVQKEIEKNNQNYKANELIQESFKKLSLREQDILKQRYLRDSPKTLAELGKRYGITRERIRQVEKQALNCLKNFILKKTEGIEILDNMEINHES